MREDHKTWLKDRIAFGCDFPTIIGGTREFGYSDDEIRATLDEVRPYGNALDEKRTLPIIRREPKNLFKLDNPKVELYMLKNFLNPGVCAILSAIIDENLRPSDVTYATDDPDFRTCRSADLCYVIDPFVEGVDRKICETLGIMPSYSEGTQAQRYETGGQFKAHLDPFDGDNYDALVGVRGQRTWTFMVYLNDVEEGGHTCFTEVDCAIKPAVGMAVFWNNLNPDGSINQYTKHAGLPVLKGHKSIITKWFRVHGHGPVYY